MGKFSSSSFFGWGRHAHYFLCISNMHHSDRYKIGFFIFAVFVTGLGLSSGSAVAEPKNDATAQALRKAQGLLRDLSQQKSQLETERSKLEERNKALEANVQRLEPLQGEVERHKSSEESLKTSAAALEHQLGSEREKYQKLAERLRQLTVQTKKIQSDNLFLVNAVKEREDWIRQCVENNKGLQQANLELVGKYKEKGFWDKVGDLEPFTGIGNVAVENVEQDYRFKLKDLEVTPFVSRAQEGNADVDVPHESRAEADKTQSETDGDREDE